MISVDNSKTLYLYMNMIPALFILILQGERGLVMKNIGLCISILILMHLTVIPLYYGIYFLYNRTNWD